MSVNSSFDLLVFNSGVLDKKHYKVHFLRACYSLHKPKNAVYVNITLIISWDPTHFGQDLLFVFIFLPL